MADKVFNKFKNQILAGSDIWTTASKIGVALERSTSTWTPADANSFVADATTAGFVEYSDTNYARTHLASATITRDDTNHLIKLDAADVSYTGLGSASGQTIKAIVLFYDNGSDATNDLIAYIDSGGTLATNGGNVTIQWNASGILTLT